MYDAREVMYDVVDMMSDRIFDDFALNITSENDNLCCAVPRTVPHCHHVHGIVHVAACIIVVAWRGMEAASLRMPLQASMQAPNPPRRVAGALAD